jgi:methionine-rich copper-binding protein CopC
VRPRRLDRRAAAGLKKLLLVLAAVAVVLAPATPALAHNQLVSAKPARDATLRQAPDAVTLAFLQKLDPEFTTVAVSDAGKQPVPASEPEVKAKTARVTLDQPLVNGKYTVAYRVVSVDGHTVQGSYTFTVADPSAAALPSTAPPSTAPSSAAPVASPSATAASGTVPVAAEADSGVPAGLLAGIGAAVVVLAAVAIFLYVSRRRRPSAGQ